MATKSELDQLISEQDEVLNSGIVQTSTDGTSTSFDLDFLNRRQRELMASNPLNVDPRRIIHPMMDVRTS